MNEPVVGVLGATGARRRIGWVVAWLVLLCPAASAWGQSYTPRIGAYRSLTPMSRPVALGDETGLSIGEMVAHIGMSLGAGYDSNVFYEQAQEGPETAPVFHLMPSLRLETPEPRGLRLTANLQLLWETHVSDSEAVQGQDGFDLLADVGAQLAPRGLFSFTVYDVLRRYAESPSSPTVETQTRFYNEAGIVAAFHPGGSERTSRLGFTGELGLGFGREIWNDRLDLDRSLFLTELDVKFYFLPKTAAFLHASYDLIFYDQAERSFSVPTVDRLDLFPSFEGTLRNVDSTPARVTGGFSGLLTRAVDFRVEGGYAAAGYDEGESYDSFLAHAMLGLFLTSAAHLSVGWRHDFQDSSFANFVAYDRFYVDLDWPMEDWLFGVGAAFELQRFAEVEVPIFEAGNTEIALFSDAEREDPVLSGNVFVGWNFRSWARLTGYYRLRANFTDFIVVTGQSSGPDRPTDASSQYVKHEVFVVTEFEY